MNRLLIFFLFVCSVSSAQKVMSTHEADSLGISIETMDKKYKSAIHENPEKAVFNTEEKQEKLVGAYQKFLQEIGVYLNQNGFKWNGRVRGWNRIYMKADGSVEYFIYRLPDDLPKEIKRRFEQLLTDFLKTSKFPVEANVPFSQCSGTVWASE